MNKLQRNLSRAGGYALLGILLLSVGGCGLFERNSEFDRVAEERPLEIPPDLDRPRGSNAMSVPATAGDADAAARFDGRQLIVDDSVDSTWRRVGLALERSGYEIASRAESARSYVVAYEDTEAREQRPGVFSRWILRRKGPEDFSGRYQLSVSPNGSGSAISVLTEDGAAAPSRVARDILDALEARLG